MTGKNIIPYGKQWIDEADINAAISVLKSDFLTQGETVPKFEKKLSAAVGAERTTVVSSGTAALHIAYMLMGLEAGDEVITTPITFAATANAALYVGARPVFIDIDKKTGLIDINKIETAITYKTKVIVPVHYAGLACDMRAIKKIADKYKIKVVEDACHALGAMIDGEKVGSCKYSDAAVFSFHPVKHITTGEGGAIALKNPVLHKQAENLRSHGIERHSFIDEPDSPCYHEMQLLGNNYRMTEISAALGCSQLDRLNMFLERRRSIAAFYRDSFRSETAFLMQTEPDGFYHAYHLFPLIFKTGEIRDAVYNMLKNDGIACQIHYMPVNRHPYYENLGYSYKDTPFAYDFYRRELSIPMYPKMTDEDAEFVVRSVKKAVEAFT